MRITGGRARGRKLFPPGPGRQTIRPTSDRVREALFNILGQDLSGIAVLDLFCGSGGFGIEALSRGAGPVIFVDRDPAALRLTSRNLAHCFHQPAALTVRLDLGRTGWPDRLVDRLPAGFRFHLIFLDPPYEKRLAEKTLEMVENANLLHPEARVVAEERDNQDLARAYGRLTLTDQRRYGQTGLWFYTLDPKNNKTPNR